MRAGEALRADTLGVVARRGVRVPTYDRGGLVPGVVHFGVGGFHRSHQAMFLDRLLEQGLAREYGVCGVGVLEGDRRAAGAFAAQDGLYSLSLKHPDGRRDIRVVGSLVSYLLAPVDPQAVVEQVADPRTRILSFTVTEGGYNRDPATGTFAAEADAVQRDLENPDAPETVFGLVAAGLRLRRERGVGGVTLMSCDNLAHNGEVARDSFTAYARLLDPSLADWMAAHVTFPGSMVDRITPVSTEADREAAERALGVHDAWPVVAEPYVQWVLEDSFAAGRPPFEHAGVQVVEDVEPFEQMKLRLANGGHQAMCHVGVLAGFTYAHEASADPAVAAYLTSYLDREAAPTLQQVPGLGLEEFKGELLGRWRNAAVADSLDRIRTDSSDRLPAWLVPVAVDNVAAGGPLEASALACAAWARACEGRDDAGRPLPVLDRAADALIEVAGRQADDPAAFLRSGLLGQVSQDSRFAEAFLAARRVLVSEGALTAAGRFL